MRKLFLLLAITVSILSNAQVSKVSLQASGLTCSMCSNSIAKALRTLDFVDKIDVKLKTYTYELSFKEGSKIDFDKIRQKVEKAGFSVSGFIATINFDNVQLQNNQPVAVGELSLVFTNPKERLLNGTKQVIVLDKGFVPEKKAKNNPWPNSSPGVYHVAI